MSPWSATWPRGACAVIVIGMILSGTVAADDTGGPAGPPTSPPDEIVITATRTSTPLFELPYAGAVVDEQRIIEESYRTTPQTLRGIPGIMVQETSQGQGSPFIRGFTGFRTLLLIDGIRLNNSVFREGPNQYWNTVDPLMIERVEVVKGPTSVLYGSDAVGGTVNVVTHRPRTWREGFAAGGRGYYRFASAERSHTGHAEVSATSGTTYGLLASGTGRFFGDLEGGRDTGRQLNTGYDETAGDFKGEYFLGPETRVVVAHQLIHQSDVPRTHQTAFAKSFRGTTVGSDLRHDNDQDRQLTYAQLHAEDLDGPFDSLHASLSWQLQSEARHRTRANGAQDRQGFTVGTLGFWTQVGTPTRIGRFTYGLEYYRDNVNSSSTSNPIQGPVADDATYDLFGLYVQDSFDVTDALEVIVGGRFNYAATDADSVQDPVSDARIGISDHWTAAVGSGRFVYRLMPDHLNVFGGISQGFRAPNLSDLTRLDIARTNELETPSPGLDPEHYLAYEIGVKARYGGGAAAVSYFYTDIDDLIVRVPTGRVIDENSEVTKVNASDGFVQGVEVEASYTYDRQWTLFGNLTWMDGEVDTFPTSDPIKSREPIDRLMPLTGLIGFRWDQPRGRLWSEALVRMADLQDDLSPRDAEDTGRIPPGGTPGYTVLDLHAGWRITEYATLIVGIDNVTDEDYRIHGSGTNMAGRNVICALDLKL